jgi:hypothetical protein
MKLAEGKLQVAEEEEPVVKLETPDTVAAATPGSVGGDPAPFVDALFVFLLLVNSWRSSILYLFADRRVG